MPRLLNFTPSAAVSVDVFTGRVSHFFVLETIQPIGLAEMEAESDAAAPDRRSPSYLLGPISVTTQWWREEGEEGREYEQMIFLIAPDGREGPLQPPTRFGLSRPFHRVLFRTGVLDVPAPGIYSLRLKLRPVDQEGWQDVIDYPFIVEDVPAVSQDSEDSRAANAPSV